MGGVGLLPAFLAGEESGDAGCVHYPARARSLVLTVGVFPVHDLSTTRNQGDFFHPHRTIEDSAFRYGVGENVFVEHGAINLITRKADIVTRSGFAALVECLGVVVGEPEPHALLWNVFLDQVLR